MTEQSLTVQQVLRYANHDFLNHLHLIKMNLDLERIEEAKELIQDIVAQCQNVSQLNKIGLPKMVEYLQTLRWRYPEFQMEFSTNITKALNEQWDELIVQYLEETILHVYDRLDPFSEQQLQIDIVGAGDEFEIAVHFTGQFNEALHFNKELNALQIQTLEQTTTSWKFVMQN
ncbi:Spo0B domain-containing protein [Lysinibacillus sp. LZ02]|uniref:Spo0B domain-containing protein n=1 Tax=Lysinibacillus sp. LZ02 TaxID=3420668 RepID=UPI003D35D2A6